MPLNTRHTAEDEAPLVDGDEQFLGVQMRGHPAGLPPGWVAAAINCRFREGIAEPRLGTVKPPWLNQIAGTSVSAWNSVQARGNYVDAERRQWTLLGVNGGVRAILPHNVHRTVPLPAGVTLTGGEQFLQFGTVVLLLRHTGGTTLQMTNLDTGFEAVPGPVAAGISAIPAARRGCVAGDRVWLVTNDNQIWASDLLDHTSWHPLNQFVAGDGAQEVVTLTPYGQTSLIVFLKHSVYRLTNILDSDTFGLLVNTTAPRVTARYGCIAADSVVDVGTDLLWLCEEGVASLTLTDAGEIQSGQGPNRPPMFSDAIQPLIQRIRWDYAAGAQGEFWDGRLYLAVPLDAAEVFGPELINSQTTNAIGVFLQTNLVVGRRYRWVSGALLASLVCGTTTLTQSGDFTATAVTATLTATVVDLVIMDGTLRELLKGVNNAVLVHDFKALQPGWQGHDEAAGLLLPRYWFRRTYNGRERLFSLNGDGWGTLYEEGFEDQIGQPYVDVVVSTVPAVGNTIRVNSGQLVTATAGTGNTATQWGCLSLAGARNNLLLGIADGTFSPLSPTVWSAPNCFLRSINLLGLNEGVRFTSTTGRRPSMVITGSWATVTTYQWQPVRMELLTRGYSTPARLERKSALKLQVLCETWNPSYTIALRSEGVNEETAFVSGQVRSRTRYDRPFTRAAWAAANGNNDFATPYRGDYSLNLGTPFKLGAGLGIGLHQAAEHVVRVSGRARAHQIRITNTAGRLRLLALGYEGRRRERGNGIKI